MQFYFKGEKFSSGGSSGGSGGSDSPVGTVISFLGLTAPAGYLICDGGEYSVSEYPALADLFKAQFGSANHFGGDGVSTFAVPDMRNLFLRGFHGEAEALSDDVGQRQEGTTIPRFTTLFSDPYRTVFMTDDEARADVRNPDSTVSTKASLRFTTAGSNYNGVGNETEIGSYMPRPVNMAVLYCVKAV